MQKQKFKILILGAQGMLGHTLLASLHELGYTVLGTIRKKSTSALIRGDMKASSNPVDLKSFENLIQEFKPDFVINCIGIIKQLKESKSKLISIEINSLWPQALADMCEKNNTRLIHFSTDCVFSGDKGNYLESDKADARDVYGLSKYLGEVDSYSQALTLRTSIVGHELNSSVSLIDWFLSQQNTCFGFKRAMYSGVTTYEAARFLDQHAFPAMIENRLSGLYHLASEPINKFDLLHLVAKHYNKQIEIKPNTEFVIDRTMNATRLQSLLNYTPPTWDQQIQDLNKYYRTIHNKPEYHS